MRGFGNHHAAGDPAERDTPALLNEILTLPIGLEATMDAGAGTLTINQAAVV